MTGITKWGFSDPYIQALPTYYTPEIIATIAQLRPKFWRLLVPWGNIVNNVAINGFTGFAQLVDPYVSMLREQVGCDIILCINQSVPSGWVPTNAANLAQLQAFCAETVTRYQPGGVGLSAEVAATGWGVRHYEFWNEENGGSWYVGSGLGNVSATYFVAMLQAAHAGIKSVLPGSPAPGVTPTGNQSVVIFGGLQHIPFEGAQFELGTVAIDEVTYLNQCYAQAEALGTTLGSMYDVMATHMYPNEDPASPPPYAAPNNIISSESIPAVCTSASPQITAVAAGSGKVNITPSTSGQLACAATITGMGQLNPFEPGGPTPSLFMDNYRQIQGIYAIMAAQGDGAKRIWITELGLGVYENIASPSGYVPVPTGFIGPTAQATYAAEHWALLQSLGYVENVLWFNVLDPDNAQSNDGQTGFGMLQWNQANGTIGTVPSGVPRPVYNWFLTNVATLDGSAQAVINAFIAGVGSIGSPGVLDVTATATGTGMVALTGAFITATITGTGIATLAPGAGAEIITATARGSGVVGIVGSAGGLATGGTPIVTALATGVGRVGVNPLANGDLLVSSTGLGAGYIGEAQGGSTIIAALFAGAGVVANTRLGLEIGVVGEVTGGTPTFTATATGTGAVSDGGTGVVFITVTIHGAGTAGPLGSGVATITATGTDAGSSVVGAIGHGPQSITATATGAGVVNTLGSGAPVITADGTVNGSVVYTDMGAKVITATATGAGVVGAVTGGAPTITATAVSGGIKLTDGGAQSITATATGSGTVGAVTGGAKTITATALGAGSSNPVGMGSPSITATITGAGGVNVVTYEGQSTGAFGTTSTVTSAVSDTYTADGVPGELVLVWVSQGTTSGGTIGDPIGSYSLTDAQGSNYQHVTDVWVPTTGAALGLLSLFTCTAPAAGSHTVTADFTNGSTSWVDPPVLAAVLYTNTLGIGTPVIQNPSAAADLSVTVPSSPNDMSVCAAISPSQLSGVNGTTRFNIGPSALGSPDNAYLLVADLPVGGTSNVFSSSSSQVVGAIGVDLIQLGLTGGGTQSIAATATGAGVVGPVGAGAPSITATATGSGFVGTYGGGAPSITATATGTGTSYDTDAGTLQVSDTATGSGVVGKVTGGTQSITATATGAGIVGAVGGGAPVITATATGTGTAHDTDAGTALITATGTGVGVVGTVTGGTQSITATALGAGSLNVHYVAPRPKVVRVFTRHRLG